VRGQVGATVRFIIEDEFRSLYPEAVIGIVIAGGIDNRGQHDVIAAGLAAAVASVQEAIGETDLASHPAVAPWREAYARFGMKPSKYRSSIEGLLRSARSRGVPSINPLVDLYNTVSLTALLPCGGEDLDAIQSDLRLTRAKGGEPFVPLGSVEDQPPAPGEVIYADDAGAICRAWNWREAERTKLTAATTRAVLVIEALPPRTVDDVAAACATLAESISWLLGGRAHVALLGANGVLTASLDD
jgi:DNA/RNA-binding domain of Phe-tRNA-synthetase-like protein